MIGILFYMDIMYFDFFIINIKLNILFFYKNNN